MMIACPWDRPAAGDE